MAKKKRQGKPKSKRWHVRSRRWKQRLKKWRVGLFKKLSRATVFLSILFFLFLCLMLRWLYYEANRPGEADLQLQYEQQQKEKFVKELVPTAQSLQREFGILASVSLAQAMIESDFGRSQLASQHFNLYGVKTDANDPQAALYPTLEYYDEEWVEIHDYFKVYASWQESMREHSLLIVNGTTWNPNQYEAVLQARTYQDQARALQSSGYATDPDYGDKLIKMIQEWQLDQYDQPSENKE